MGKKAIVIGAGMGGLSAARAIADYFEQVVVLERDTLPADPIPRIGTPQAQHVHVLLTSGLNALRALFPHFEQDLIQAGAVPLRVALDVRLERPGFNPFPQRDLGWLVYSMSRPLLEHTVRRQLAGYPNITVRQLCRAENVLTNSDGGRVRAVQCETRDGSSEVLPAEVVIDASGRGNPTLALLKSLGRPPPEETIIGVDYRYTTALIPIPPTAPPEWKGVFTFAEAPASTCGALMLPIEGNRWIVGLGGAHGASAPAEWDGFLTFAQQLRTPTVYDAIKHSTPPDRLPQFGFPESVWRHFERLPDLPTGLLPVGDAICRFNPIYGQGMSVAAQEAFILHRLLKSRSALGDPLVGLSAAFFQEAVPLIDAPWAIAANLDFVYPQTRGQRPADLEGTLKFGAALNRIAARDPAVHKLTLEVQHLLKPRGALLTPELVQRVQAEMAAVS
jgi:2-polyprenyl-6-methoxyphenol hydroxylase-like FAD-dependent oxidoreductase